MNTLRSTWIGWGSLCLAGGGAYYFAKRSINADRAARHEADMKKRRLQQSLEYSSKQASNQSKQNPKPTTKGSDHAGSPSAEASDDPAPTRHAPDEKGGGKKSKYEASEVYRSKKGDRLS